MPSDGLMQLTDRVALVTGSDSGIGRGIATLYGQAGADLVVTYFSDEVGAQETAAEIRAMGRRAHVVQVDVGDPAAVERLFGEVDEVFGRIDILVNNAGVSRGGNVVDLDFDTWDWVIRTNLYGPFLCSQQAARRMLGQGNGGRIINITSVHEEACGPGASAYNASKGGLRNLTRTLAVELAHEGILVTGIAPGMIVTPMNHVAMVDAEYRDRAGAMIPVRRPGVPDDVANMALFLASDLAAYCTGQTYYVDGGWMLTQPPV